MVTFNSLNLVVSRKPPISIHLEGDVLWDWPLFKGANKHLSCATHEPFSRGRLPEPIPNMGQVKIGHDEGRVSGTFDVVAQYGGNKSIFAMEC